MFTRRVQPTQLHNWERIWRAVLDIPHPRCVRVCVCTGTGMSAGVQACRHVTVCLCTCVHTCASTHTCTRWEAGQKEQHFACILSPTSYPSDFLSLLGLHKYSTSPPALTAKVQNSKGSENHKCVGISSGNKASHFCPSQKGSMH